MVFAKKKDDAAPRVSADRLAAIAGGGMALAEEPAQSAGPAARTTLKPDLSRIRPRGVVETPEQRKKRLTAKTINFTFTILARLVIMAALGVLLWSEYEFTGTIQRGPAVGMIVLFADLGRVILKAMEPGTK